MNTLSIIVAIAENRAIGKQQQLLCHLPDDLKRFKRITGGHTIIMGRKTFESLPNGALPNRKNIVLSKTENLSYPGAFMCPSLEKALELCKDEDEVFIIGGAAVYESAMKLANKLYITRIHHKFDDADTFFPEFDETNWIVTEKESFPADEKHPYPYTFVTYTRK